VRRAHSIAVHLAVFLTGCTALVYEVIWQRYLSRITGNEVLATSLILGLFLAGLSAGYAISGSISRCAAHPARWYGPRGHPLEDGVKRQKVVVPNAVHTSTFWARSRELSRDSNVLADPNLQLRLLIANRPI
jgi:hypothetical protein